MENLVKTRAFIVVQFQLLALHQWKQCDIKEVEFLKHKHSHTFHFKLVFEVNELNREKEFFVEKSAIIGYLRKQYATTDYASAFLDFNNNSCEMLADELLKVFNATRVEVYEDGLDGAIVKQE